MANRLFDVRRQRGFTTIALFSFFALYVPIAVLVVFWCRYCLRPLRNQPWWLF